MKTLLRNTHNGLYLKAARNWTNDPSQALDFRFIDHALKYVEIWGIKPVELAFVFDNPPAISVVSLAKAAVRYTAAA